MIDQNSPENIVLSDQAVIDFESAIPFYYQIQLYIQEHINSEEWVSGQKLPSEKELCDHFNVSRTVVRQALGGLESDNLIETIKGKGSFVNPKKHAWQLMQSLQGFYENAVASGQTIKTKVLELEDIPAPTEIAEFLKLESGERVTKMKRLRFADDEPILVVTTYIPKKICPDLVNVDFSDKSLYVYLRESCGLVIAEGIRTIESVNASEELSNLLQIEDGAALSLLRSIGWTSDGTPLEYYVAWHRGDRSRFQVRLVADNSQDKSIIRKEVSKITIN
jgi:GntR family transcriptional regulator